MRKQRGHSGASLYKNASIRCPLTYGSSGNLTSLGVRSPELLFLLVKEAASVLARPRKRGFDELSGEVGDGAENAGCDGERVEETSDA